MNTHNAYAQCNTTRTRANGVYQQSYRLVNIKKNEDEKMDGYPNLKSNDERTPEERRQLAIKAGKASGKVRALRKTLRETLKEMLNSRIPKESPYYLKLKTSMEALGLKGQPDVQVMTTIGILQKAAKGDSTAFAVVRDTIGEKPVDQQEIVNPEPIVLGVIPQSMIDAAKAEKETTQK